MLAFLVSFSLAATSVSAQPTETTPLTFSQTDIDQAFEVILQTRVGCAIVHHLLGAEEENLSFHLGISPSIARTAIKNCPEASGHEWIYPSPADRIRKMTLTPNGRRKYEVIFSNPSFPIESWTDPFSNTTVLVTDQLPLTKWTWIQLLAHETAVYFDSKNNLLHAEARSIPELRQLNISYHGLLNPLVVAADPLIGHGLAYLRALQFDQAVIEEIRERRLVDAAEMGPPSGQEISKLTGVSCGHACVLGLIEKVRDLLKPFSLPLMALAPLFRPAILEDLSKLSLGWRESDWIEARRLLHHAPVNFLLPGFGTEPLLQMKKAFYERSEVSHQSLQLSGFLDRKIWPMERQTLDSARLNNPEVTFLEYLKRPLLSGYNIGLSGGPRVRIRTGGVE
ncbi:MAG: hypothetical protein AB7F86_00460 [Bdellovibrionales bacterium]